MIILNKNNVDIQQSQWHWNMSCRSCKYIFEVHIFDRFYCSNLAKVRAITHITYRKNSGIRLASKIMILNFVSHRYFLWNIYHLSRTKTSSDKSSDFAHLIFRLRNFCISLFACNALSFLCKWLLYRFSLD